MPQRNAPGGASKKKKGRAPKHQNTFAFRHNPKSKKTDKILNSPNVGVCRRCHEKIEWRKKYRKYKPRTQPGKCNLCSQKNVKAAYHTICTDCTGSDRAIEDMERKRGVTSSSAAVKDKVQTSSEMDETAIKRARRRLRVCAMCAAEPALSKHSYGDGHDEDLIEEIHLLEDKIEDGVNDDGKKLTLREIKSLERKIEKLQIEMKERRKNRENKEDEDGDKNEDDNIEDGSDGEEAERAQIGQIMEEQNDEDDPFLLAVGGKDKLLVGDDYQKMLLARGQQT